MRLKPEDTAAYGLELERALTMWTDQQHPPDTHTEWIERLRGFGYGTLTARGIDRTPLDGPLTIYRGCTPDGVLGMSWTLSLRAACRYSGVVNADSFAGWCRGVWRASASPDAVLARIDVPRLDVLVSRQDEVIVDPALITDVVCGRPDPRKPFGRLFAS